MMPLRGQVSRRASPRERKLLGTRAQLADDEALDLGRRRLRVLGVDAVVADERDRSW